MVNLTSADVQDAAGAEAIIAALRRRWPWVKHLFADGAYDRGRLASAAAYQNFVMEVVRMLDGEPGLPPSAEALGVVVRGDRTDPAPALSFIRV